MTLPRFDGKQGSSAVLWVHCVHVGYSGESAGPATLEDLLAQVAVLPPHERDRIARVADQCVMSSAEWAATQNWKLYDTERAAHAETKRKLEEQLGVQESEVTRLRAELAETARKLEEGDKYGRELLERNEKLRAEIVSLKDECGSYQNSCVDYADLVVRLRAENEKLRAERDELDARVQAVRSRGGIIW